MKKKISLILCLVMIVSVLLSLTGCSSDSDYARITDVDYTAKVIDIPRGEGKVVITERITFDVHAADPDDGFWELWRELPENYIDGVKVHYKVNSVKQIMPDGSAKEWKQSPKLYWDDYDYVNGNPTLGPGKWFHSKGPYDEAARNYECLLFYVDNVYREKLTFEIEYEMYNAVLRYGDCSDLYISMYSGESIKYLNSFKGRIMIASDKMPRQGNYEYVTYGTNGGDFEVKESAGQNLGFHTFYFDLDKSDLKFSSDNQFLEFDLVAYGADKHIFAQHASRNDYYNVDVLDEIFAQQREYKYEAIYASYVKFAIFLICILASITAVLKAIAKVKKYENKYQFYSPEPTSATFRDIPSDLDPNFASALVLCKDKVKVDEASVYSAILLSLARKKYIELKEVLKLDVTINLLEPEMPELEPIAVFKDGDFDWYQPQPVDPREPLTPSEELYLNLIKRHAKKGSITMDEFQRRISSDYNYTNNFAKNMKKVVTDIGVNLKYFRKADYLEPKHQLTMSASGNYIVGIIMTFVSLICLTGSIGFAYGGLPLVAITYWGTGYYLNSQAHKYVLLTKLGEEEYSKWRGLYNFLKSDTLISERTYIELPLWEKYLVYATAFGLSDNVIKAIKIRCPQVVTGAGGTPSIVHSNYCRSGRIRTSGAHFHSSVRHGSTSYSSFNGSSSHGSFGYGGGGRGGGGGGGGH